LATRVHGFSTKTRALAREIPPATQAISIAGDGMGVAEPQIAAKHAAPYQPRKLTG